MPQAPSGAIDATLGTGNSSAMNAYREVDILLVEDNLADAELTIEALRSVNLANRLVWVRNGEEALQFLFGHDTGPATRLLAPPRLVLLDLRLPKVDGLEVLRALRQNQQTCRVPVVVMTSSSHEEDLRHSYRHGVNSFVRKPAGFDDFARVVAQLGLYWLPVNRAP